jgi:death-on-curing protein
VPTRAARPRHVREREAPDYRASPDEPTWLSREIVDVLHDRSLTLYGGMAGVNSENLIESALARPRNLFAYVGADLPRLAAAYAFGVAKNHGYRDGNKRTAFLSAAVFLDMNGLELVADEHDALVTMLELATGIVTEEAFAEWLRPRVVPRA